MSEESPNDQTCTKARVMILMWMSFQNAFYTIIVSYSRSRPVKDMYLPSVAVFWMEIIKLVFCVIVVSIEKASIPKGLSNIRRTVFGNPMDTLKVCVPSLVYTISNNLFYIAATYLDAATFAITSQLKLFTAAVFSVLILRKPLSRLQWTALLIVFAGVSLVQWSTLSLNHNKEQSESRSHKSTNKKTDTGTETSSALFGFMVACLASTLAGFAGVYFEKILKARTNAFSAEVTVWMRNVQLAISSVPIALITAYVADGPIVKEHGLFYGFDTIVWLTVSFASIGGLSAAVCIKYTDSISKNFATSIAIIFVTVLSMFVFQFRPTIYFAIGAAMVMGAIFMFTKYSRPGVGVIEGEEWRRVDFEIEKTVVL